MWHYIFYKAAILTGGRQDEHCGSEGVNEEIWPFYSIR